MFDPQPSQVGQFSAIMFSNSPPLNLVNPLLGDTDHLVARELEPGPEGLTYMLLVLRLGTGGHDDLANVDPGHCAWGLPRHHAYLAGALAWGHQASHECPLGRAVSKVP